MYKEALIDLVQVLEEARQFMKTFTRTKTVSNRIQEYCYAKTVKVVSIISIFFSFHSFIYNFIHSRINLKTLMRN